MTFSIKIKLCTLYYVLCIAFLNIFTIFFFFDFLTFIKYAKMDMKYVEMAKKNFIRGVAIYTL